MHLFTYDEGNDIYQVQLNGIRFITQNVNDDIETFTKQLADQYFNRLNDIISFIQDDIKAMYDIDDPIVIQSSLGIPEIDVERCIITYLHHTFDQCHIIDVEFSGVFDEFLYTSIDG